MENLTQKQFWIWLAGFIDGEGCIYVCKNKNKNSWGFQCVLRLEITQADKNLLEHIKNRIGFGTNIHNKGINAIKNRISRRDVYSIKWSSNQAYEVIENVLPYLVVKKKQAILGMQFQELVREHYGKKINRPIDYVERQLTFRGLLQLAKQELYKAP